MNRTYYIFIPPKGYRTQADLEKRLQKLQKKDAATLPSTSPEISRPDLRDFHYYVTKDSEWYRKYRNFRYEDLISNTRFYFYRDWISIEISPRIPREALEYMEKCALEGELIFWPMLANE